MISTSAEAASHSAKNEAKPLPIAITRVFETSGVDGFDCRTPIEVSARAQLRTPVRYDRRRGSRSENGVLVLCNGVPRSASTWAFNVALELLRGSYPSSEVRYGYDESVVDFLAAVPLTADHAVMKCHNLDAPGKALARIGALKTIYTWRDPADAAVSCMRKLACDFERAMSLIEPSLALHPLHREWGTALILAYDEIMAGSFDAIVRISQYLGLERNPGVLEAVAAETSFERVKEKVGQLDSDGDRLTRAGEVYDPETLYHPGHISDGSSGYGRRILSADEVRRCDALLERYIDKSDSPAESGLAWIDARSGP